MTRRATVWLAGVGAYGAAMAVGGVALILGGGAGSAGVAGQDQSVVQLVGQEQEPATPLDAATPLDGAAAVGGSAGESSASGPVPSAGGANLAGGASASAAPAARGSAAVGSAAVGRGQASVDASGIPAARQASAGPGQASSFQPVEIALPNGSTAPIEPADVSADGALEIPVNPRVVGLWTGGARPGERFGSVVIAGHVDSARFGIGVLAGLKGVRAGEVIELSAGSARLRYRVTATRTVRQQSLATDDQYFRQDGPPRLVVITCGGPFDSVRHRYLDNYIVLASPLT